MFDGARDRLHHVLFWFPKTLATLGLVDRQKGEAAFDLAVPAMVTGGLRTILRTADFFMVSIALGSSAVAALEFGFQYYFIPFGLALALTSGTISVVSRFKGRGAHDRADFAVKQSLYMSIIFSVPITVFTWVYAEPMIDLLTDNPDTVRQGAVYIRIVMLSLVFRFWSMAAARALAGAGDTRTPMYVRSLTLPTNIALNAVLIFGVGPIESMGIAGAAWGTAIANTLAATIFFWLFLSGRRAVSLRLGGKQWDWSIAKELVRVGLPLAGTRLSRTFGRFPFLFVLSVLGTEIVAAYAIARRVMLLAMMPAWGYSTAASTLVGQSIGAGDDEEASAYGWETLRIALITQLLIGALIFIAAAPLARLFEPESVARTVDFVRLFGVGVAAFSVSRTMRGGLRGAGDTSWPFYGGVVGTYLVRLPLAFVALPVGFVISIGPVWWSPGFGWGLVAVYAAILGDMYVRAAINLVRFASGKWKQVARDSAVGPSTVDG